MGGECQKQMVLLMIIATTYSELQVSGKSVRATRCHIQHYETIR